MCGVIKIFGSAVTPSRVIRLYRIWLPLKASNYIYHCVYELRVNQDLKKRSRNTFGKVINFCLQTAKIGKVVFDAANKLQSFSV